jgi:hypothetical protein
MQDSKKNRPKKYPWGVAHEIDERKMLEYARKGDFKEVVKCIEEKKVFIGARDKDGWTVLAWAITHGDYRMVRYCFDSGQPFWEVKEDSLAYAAMCCGDVKKIDERMLIVKNLIRHRDINGFASQECMALFWAFYYHNIELVKYLIEQGAHIGSKAWIKELEKQNFHKGMSYLYYVEAYKKNGVRAQEVCDPACMPWYMPLYFLKNKDGKATTYLLDFCDKPKDFGTYRCQGEMKELFEAQPQECMEKYQECRLLAQRLKKYRLEQIFVGLVARYKHQQQALLIKQHPKSKKDLFVHFE